MAELRRDVIDDVDLLPSVMNHAYSKHAAGQSKFGSMLIVMRKDKVCQ